MSPTDRELLKQKPSKVDLRPGQKWASADRGTTAVVTSTLQECRWGREDVTIVSYYRTVGETPATLERVGLEIFEALYPVRVD